MYVTAEVFGASAVFCVWVNLGVKKTLSGEGGLLKMNYFSI